MTTLFQDKRWYAIICYNLNEITIFETPKSVMGFILNRKFYGLKFRKFTVNDQWLT